MTMPLTSRLRNRRAEEFARLLDGDPTSNDPSLAPLAQLATALRSVPLGPNPDFRDGLRQRLVAVATVQGVGPVSASGAVAVPGARTTGRPAVTERLTEWAEGWRVRRRLVAATATMSAVVMVGGIGLAGSRSLPGEPFYGIKRGVEHVQLAAARGHEAKGERHLQFARTRLHEVSALVGSSSALGVGGSRSGPVAGSAALGGSLAEHVRSTLRAMDRETVAGTRDLTLAYQTSRDQKPLRTLKSFAREQSSRLTAVLPDLPSTTAREGNESLILVQQIDAQADNLLASAACTAACSAGTPSAPGVAPSPGTVTGTNPTPAPCTCTPSTAGDGSGGTGSEPNPGGTPAPGAEPTQTPEPSGSPAPGDSPTATPSPTPTTLEDQIGGILSQLPIPITPPPLPLPDLPVPTPTLPSIHLPR
jgi:hypothetical protein